MYHQQRGVDKTVKLMRKGGIKSMIGEIDLIRKHSNQIICKIYLKRKIKNVQITNARERNASERKIKNQLCSNTLHCYNQVEDKKSLGLYKVRLCSHPGLQSDPVTRYSLSYNQIK